MKYIIANLFVFFLLAGVVSSLFWSLTVMALWLKITAIVISVVLLAFVVERWLSKFINHAVRMISREQ